ncbi:MAG: hypothetical protein AAF799_21695 [Myxococcota bacterium]
MHERMIVVALVASLGTACGSEPAEGTPSAGTTTGAGSSSSTPDSSGGPASSSGEAEPTTEIVPGVGIGDLTIGARGDALADLAGEPDSSLRFGNLVLLTFENEGLEVLLVAPIGEELTATAKVLSIAALSSDIAFSGPALPGEEREDVLMRSGTPSESVGDADFYEAGWSVVYRASGKAKSVTVFTPYTIAIEPPPMTPIGG